MRNKRVATWVAGLLMGWLYLGCTWGVEPVDQYGGWWQIRGEPGDSFHVEKIADRWWLVTPEGHGIFIRAVSKVDTSDYGGSGGFMAYDGVFLENAGAISPNLAAAAESSIPADVIQAAHGVTLQPEGDALYLGSSRFKPNYSYFWLDRLGQGGRIEWYYSTESGWKRIQDDGRPLKAEAIGSVEGWNLDVGNYIAPDENGFGKPGNPQANRITWWDMAEGFPDDFVPVPLPCDATRRWYLKAVVQREFAVGPVLNQAYERADLTEWIAKKYTPGDTYAKWAQAMTHRLRSWGFNAAGQYSYRYIVQAPTLADRLPVEPTWALGGWVAGQDRPYRAKNVYTGAVFPPGSNRLLYEGLQPDTFDPKFETGYLEMVRQEASARNPWSWALIPEEADYLFGLNSLLMTTWGTWSCRKTRSSPALARRPADLLRRSSVICEVRIAGFPAKPVSGPGRATAAVRCPNDRSRIPVCSSAYRYRTCRPEESEYRMGHCLYDVGYVGGRSAPRGQRVGNGEWMDGRKRQRHPGRERPRRGLRQAVHRREPSFDPKGSG